MQGGLAKDCIHNTLWLIPILFGLKGILANFQHLMDKLLRGVESYAVAYLDDLSSLPFSVMMRSRGFIRVEYRS